jgi:membrane-associated phospholipid phosphatase
VTPFVLENAGQFRPPQPPEVSSPEYLDALAEVRDLGRDSSTTRSADQTVAARFWSAPIWNSWNEIAQRTALSRHMGLVRTARLFADLNLAFADGVIAFYDAKYHDRVWRPITAIRETDPGWTPLVATPADPSYPGAHSVISAAAETILSRYFGDHTAITVSSELLPGVTRSFPSFGEASVEAGVSRIDAGVHTRIDHEVGLRLGHRVAGLVLERATSG